ncbi:MAG: hypothetical protein HYS87_02240 [Candidatus Colwellbacteria bacterium]|nr:hypothetical protein [Candidatus Colwellbacteria bacterium]
MRQSWIILIPLAFVTGFMACYLWSGFTPESLETNLEATIGFIGCSNTAQSVMGYSAVGGDEFWGISDDRKHDFDGGAVADWVDIGNKFWHTFDNYYAANPNTDTIWWQMCVRSDEDPTLEDALEIVSGIKGRIPDVTIYVSSLPSYQEGICRITGTSGLARGKELASELVLKSDVRRGPELRSHEPSEILDDGCHMNDEGLRAVGEQLKQFFDSV